MDRLVIGVDVGTGSARAGVFDAEGRCLGRAERPIRMVRPLPDHAEHEFGGHLALRVRLRARGGRALGRGSGGDRRHRLRCHLLSGGPRRRRGAALRLGQRRAWARHHRVARPPRRRGGRGMHRQRPSGARPCRRRHVTRDGDPQADVAEAPSPGDLGTRRPVPRPRRLSDLARQRQHGPIRVHRHLQVDLSRPRAGGLAGRISWRPAASATSSSAVGCRAAPRRSAAISARSPPTPPRHSA